MPNRTGTRHEIKTAKREEAKERQEMSSYITASRARARFVELGQRSEFTTNQWMSDSFINQTWKTFVKSL